MSRRPRCRGFLSKKLAAVAGIGWLGFVSMAGAATINIDINSSDGGFGTYSGMAAAPAAGTIWNGFVAGPEGGSPLVGSVTSGPLVTSTGVASSVTVTLGNFRVYEANENSASTAPALFTDFVYQQNLGPGGPNSTFSINGLTPGITYDLYFYAQNGGYSNTATGFTIGATSLTATNPVGGGDPGGIIQNVNYVKFTGVAPSAGGVISGTFNDIAPANNAAFNGLQIVEVPEPGSAALLGLAALAAVRRRR
ncbi:MAG TPA: PEP-CTERM sorting domain-containing protein [Verrucomicrobiales bacterium]|nr:PEP-CTERM sorting domain-containing protein [Verrucomicrobiales bacterium]